MVAKSQVKVRCQLMVTKQYRLRVYVDRNKEQVLAERIVYLTEPPVRHQDIYHAWLGRLINVVRDATSNEIANKAFCLRLNSTVQTRFLVGWHTELIDELTPSDIALVKKQVPRALLNAKLWTTDDATLQYELENTDRRSRFTAWLIATAVLKLLQGASGKVVCTSFHGHKAARTAQSNAHLPSTDQNPKPDIIWDCVGGR